MIDRRLVQNFDWKLLGLTIVLSFTGVITVYSAVTTGISNIHQILYVKQIIWYCAGMFLMIIAFLFNYNSLERYAFIIYGFCIFLLLMVLIIGKYAGGAKRWLMFGPLTFQPSELAKLAVILVLARYYSKAASVNGLSLSELTIPIVLCIVPFALIVLQPDLGTAMIILLIAVSMTLFVKIEKKTAIFLFTSATVTFPTIWFFLRDYQKKRIITFLNPEIDPLGSGYHIIQSKIAIGSGMVTGKGFLKGTQSALSFLPEQQTDFIFSVFAEQWGFIGSFLLLLVFFMFITRCLKITYGSKNYFGAILSFGITSMLLWHIVVNMGMVMGLMPVVGVTLPFISYGGSSIIVTLTGIGILLNISMRRFLFN